MNYLPSIHKDFYTEDIEGYVIFEENLKIIVTDYTLNDALEFAKSDNIWLEFERDFFDTEDPNRIKVIGCSKFLWWTKKYFIGYVPEFVAFKIVKNVLIDYLIPQIISVESYTLTVQDLRLGFMNIHFRLIGQKEFFDTYEFGFRDFYPKDIEEYTVYEENIEVAGTKYRIKDALEFAKSENIWLEFEHEFANKEDPNAIKVIGCSKSLRQIKKYFIGYVPRFVALKIVRNNLLDYVMPQLTYVKNHIDNSQGVNLRMVNITFRLVGQKKLFDTYESDDETEFYLEGVVETIRKISNIGDKVSIWMKPDNSGIIVYNNKGNRIGGEGKIGYVPRFFEKRIIHNIRSGGAYEATIQELKENICKIKCIKITPEDVMRIREESLENYKNYVRNNLEKIYNPKSPIILKFYIDQNSISKKVKIRKWDFLKLEVVEKEKAISDLENIYFNIFDLKNNFLTKVESPRETVIRILRGIYSGYTFEVQVTNKLSHGLFEASLTPQKKTYQY